MRKRIAIAIELDHPVPWHLDCYQGILQYADEHDWACVVDPYLVGMTGQSDVSDYDGVVGRITLEVAQSAAAHDIPVINHWQNSPAKDLPSVLFDYHEGARLAGEHLVSCGYRRFAHLGISTQAVNMLDLTGLTEALEQHGFAEADKFEFAHDFEAGREGVIHMRRVLTSWLEAQTSPVGVLAQNSVTARYLAQICGEMGLKVPEDVGIVVQLGDHVLSMAASPTLTVVDSDYFGIGYQSAAYLDELMSGEPADSQARRIVPTRLTVRESSDFYLSSDPLVTEAMRYIADHCRQTLRVEDLADALNTSRRTLERRFEEVVGRSVYSEVARLRGEYVKRQLIETDRPLSEIAQDCGFSSASHFTRFFSNVVGMTPSAFRKKQTPSRGRIGVG
ncbi:MAG: substrate-binding domain-containing protein [Phycisphaeraceae bacterium]|nr:substrate-binding domain-containing protein [Phycisphaeraceae bacterium]